MSPLEWHWIGEDHVRQKWDMRRRIDGEVNLSFIEDALADNRWSSVSPHEATGGLETGEPDLKIPKKVIASLLKEGKLDEVRALEHIVCHRTWNGTRAHPKDLALAVCLRCGKAEDTLMHSYWSCKDHLNSTAQCVEDTQHLVGLAEQEDAEASAYWLGGILPRANALPRPLKVIRAEAHSRSIGPFLGSHEDLWPCRWRWWRRRTQQALHFTCGVSGKLGHIFPPDTRQRDPYEGGNLLQGARQANSVPGRSLGAS